MPIAAALREIGSIDGDAISSKGGQAHPTSGIRSRTKPHSLTETFRAQRFSRVGLDQASFYGGVVTFKQKNSNALCHGESLALPGCCDFGIFSIFNFQNSD